MGLFRSVKILEEYYKKSSRLFLIAVIERDVMFIRRRMEIGLCVRNPKWRETWTNPELLNR